MVTSGHIAVGWLLWVSLRVNDVLFELGLRCVAVGDSGGYHWWLNELLEGGCWRVR